MVATDLPTTYNPAYNVQLATDVDSGVIVGVSVVSEGNDAGQAETMVTQVEQRSGVAPESYLMSLPQNPVADTEKGR